MQELIANPAIAAFWLAIGLGIAIALYAITRIAISDELDSRQVDTKAKK